MKKTIIMSLLLILVTCVVTACGGQAEPTPTLTSAPPPDTVVTEEVPAVSPESTVEPERTADLDVTEEATDEVTDESSASTGGQVIPVGNTFSNEDTIETAALQQETAEAEGEATEESAGAGDESANDETDDVTLAGETPADICAANVPAEEPAAREFTEPEQVLEAGVDYRAVICTDAGPVYVDLFEELAPVTVNNFVFLAENGYYNNTIFHRVLQDFMAQGGDPTGTGTGGPGYQFLDEYVGFLTFDRPGLLAMANANRPEQGIVGTNGSQFFITTVSTPHLNFRHTIFGEVLEGQDNVAAMQLRDPSSPDVTADTPATMLQTVVIITEPEAVASSYEAAASASAEEVMAAFEAFSAVLPPDLKLTTSEQIDDIDATVGRTAEEIQPQYRDFLTANNFEYSVDSVISNDTCNLQGYVFTSAGYQLMAFASQADASAALQDGFFAELATAEGYETSELTTLGQPVYVRTEQICDTEVRSGLTFVQRGRFIVVLRVGVPVNPSFDVDIVLDQLVARNYELSLGDVLRREITSQ